jgi:hypothetical protein
MEVGGGRFEDTYSALLGREFSCRGLRQQRCYRFEQTSSQRFLFFRFAQLTVLRLLATAASWMLACAPWAAWELWDQVAAADTIALSPRLKSFTALKSTSYQQLTPGIDPKSLHLYVLISSRGNARARELAWQRKNRSQQIGAIHKRAPNDNTGKLATTAQLHVSSVRFRDWVRFAK